MEEQIKELANRVNNLEKLFNQNQQNINFNLGLTWAILAVVITVIAFSITIIVKELVNKRMDKEMVKVKNDILNEIYNNVGRVQQGIYAGNAISSKVEITVSKINKDLTHSFNRLELWATKSQKVLEYNACIVDNGTKIII